MSLSRLHGVMLLGCSLVCALSACGGGGGGGTSAAPPPCSIPDKTCYVRVSGNDTNSGADPDHALRTIAKAAQLALSGYTVIVGPGTYREGVTPISRGAVPQALTFTADTLGLRTADRPGPVVIDASSTSVAAGFKFSNSRGTLIDGFTILGGADGGIVIKSTSDNFVIRNCIIHDNPGDGIRVQDSANVLVFNNLVYRNGFGQGGDGIVIAGEVSGSPNANVISNTVVGNAVRGLRVGTTSAPSQNGFVHNNIIQDNAVSQRVENIKVFVKPRSDQFYKGDFNLVVPATYAPDSIKGASDIGVDARFLNENGPVPDLHLNTASPAIDRGDNLDPTLTQILHDRTTTGVRLDNNGALDIGFHFAP